MTWGPWVRDNRTFRHADGTKGWTHWRNAVYHVAVRRVREGDVRWHLSVGSHDGRARHDWRDLQRIKNELVGPEYEAVELYPAESRLVDESNRYHLWVFKKGTLPFGFSDRSIRRTSTEGAYQRQRRMKKAA